MGERLLCQLGERLLCKQEVIGSNPFTSTTGKARLRLRSDSGKVRRWHPEVRPARRHGAAATFGEDCATAPRATAARC